MNAAIQDTLFQIFEHVRHDPETLPVIPLDSWPEGSTERHLLESFHSMLEQVQQRILQFKQTEQDLREREEQYRSVFEASFDGLNINTLDGAFVEANPALCRMFGYTREELLSISPTALIHPDSLHVMSEVLQEVGEGRESFKRATCLRKDGTSFLIEARVTPFLFKGQRHLLSVTRDITEQMRAEEQLREREEQYRAIFEASSDGLTITDLEDGHAVEANPAACKMFGYTYEEMIRTTPTATIHPDSFHHVAKALEAVQTVGYYQARLVAVRKDGTTFPLDGHGTPFIYKGKPHLLGVMRDITKQVQAEQELREREEQYRGVFEAASDAMFISTLEGGVVEANPAACKMLGYSYEEIIGLSPAVLAHPDFLSQATEALQALQAGRNASSHMVLLRKDGTAFPMEGRATTFTYKGSPHVLAVIRDITERVEAEKQLREKEEQYRSIFEITYDALMITDLDGFVVEANPAACQMYGYTREELIGLHASSFTAPVSLPILTDVLNTIKRERDFQVVGLGLRKDGTTFYTEAQGLPITYAGKRHALGTMRDITEQMQAQQLLEQRVEERTRELSLLLEISHTVASTLELKPLLGLILDQIKAVVDYTGAAILAVEGEELVHLDTRGPVAEEYMMQVRFPLKGAGPILEMVSMHSWLIIDDVRDETPLSQTWRAVVGELGETILHYVRGLLVVPLVLKERAIGLLVLNSHDIRAFTEHHATLALAIANQAAIAIENARLYEQARVLAALEERQKLARELHDSVSQALYGISLGIHTARTALDRDPSQLAEPLDYVLSLTEAALAEMRALIFELRPESLETEGLVSALTKQAAALHARHHVLVSTELCTEPDLPLKVKQDLYRIVQEALHNTVKHARANKVKLHLEHTAEGNVLEIHDDGVGFDTTASFPGHLGLHSMRERVTNIGGTFEIESALGVGTRICVRIPGRERIHL